MSVLCPAASFSDTDPLGLLPQAPVFASEGHVLEGSGGSGMDDQGSNALSGKRVFSSPDTSYYSYTMVTGVLCQG